MLPTMNDPDIDVPAVKALNDNECGFFRFRAIWQSERWIAIGATSAFRPTMESEPGNRLALEGELVGCFDPADLDRVFGLVYRTHFSTYKLLPQGGFDLSQIGPSIAYAHDQMEADRAAGIVKDPYAIAPLSEAVDMAAIRGGDRPGRFCPNPSMRRAFCLAATSALGQRLRRKRRVTGLTLIT